MLGWVLELGLVLVMFRLRIVCVGADVYGRFYREIVTMNPVYLSVLISAMMIHIAL